MAVLHKVFNTLNVHLRDFLILMVTFIASCALSYALYKEIGLSGLTSFCIGLLTLFLLTMAHVSFLRFNRDADLQHHIDMLYRDIEYLRFELKKSDNDQNKSPSSQRLSANASSSNHEASHPKEKLISGTDVKNDPAWMQANLSSNHLLPTQKIFGEEVLGKLKHLAEQQELILAKAQGGKPLDHQSNQSAASFHKSDKKPPAFAQTQEQLSMKLSQLDESEIEKAEALLHKIRDVGGGKRGALKPYLENLSDEGVSQIRLNTLENRQLDHQISSEKSPKEDSLIEELADALASDRVDLYLQPIVSMPGRHLRFYEILTRIRDKDGTLHMPDLFLSIAEYAGLMPLLDNIVILKAVTLAKSFAERGKPRALFCNLSSQSLLDEDFFSDFMNFLGQNKWLQGQIYFEVAQEDIERMPEPLSQRLSLIAGQGFGIVIDRVKHLDIDFHRLKKWNVKFVKIDVAQFLGGVENIGAPFPNEDLRPFLERFGISLIVDKMENEGQAIEVGVYQIPFAQGYLFSEPKPVRTDVLKNPQLFGKRSQVA